MPAADGAFGDYPGRVLVLDPDGSRESGDHCAYMPRARQAIGFQHHDTGAQDYDARHHGRLTPWCVGLSE